MTGTNYEHETMDYNGYKLKDYNQITLIDF